MTAAHKVRKRDHAAGRCAYLPVRYADEFIVLVFGTQENALAKKSALADYLPLTIGLELSSQTINSTPRRPRALKPSRNSRQLERLSRLASSAHLIHVAMCRDKRYGYGPRVQIPKPSQPRPLTCVERSSNSQ